MSTSDPFTNTLKQLEESRGKPREVWDIEDWKIAAESLERTVSVLGKLLVNTVEVAQSLSKPAAGLRMVKAKPKKKGRPRKTLEPLVGIRRFARYETIETSSHATRTQQNATERNARFAVRKQVRTELGLLVRTKFARLHRWLHQNGMHRKKI